MKGRIFRTAGVGERAAAGRVVLICAIWAGVHSLLASKTAKELAVRVAGARSRDGLYRLAYNAQSVLSVAWAARWFLRLPDRELYRARFPWSLLFRIGQAASLGVLFSGVKGCRRAGIRRPRPFVEAAGGSRVSPRTGGAGTTSRR
jgi:hypothetical protein